MTRTCVYDRADLGRSGPAPGPRGLPELVGDLSSCSRSPIFPALTCWSVHPEGYITAGYACCPSAPGRGHGLHRHRAPWHPPPEIVEETDPKNPTNIEKRDYLQVEKDAWTARKRIGDIPVTIVTAKPPAAEIKASPFPSEQRALRRNVEDQQGWLVLSPRAKQIVVHSGHAVEEENPGLVIDAILGVVNAAQ